ncbi:MAG: phosphomannomutase/phosphoglucomutase [Parcubacteria group bacterium]|nr:phosphomannomutase/phosphoglucomutase [Parcubacteria group bacterium]
MIDSIFKSYDIRGVYPSELDENNAHQIAKAFFSLIKKENPRKNLKLVVGRDMRLSSPQIHERVIAALVESGAHVIDVGLVSTPTFYFAVSYYGYDGGILVSASHNPKQYNGLKMVRSKALPISGDSGIYWMRDLCKGEKFLSSKRQGSLEKKEDVLQKQVEVELAYGAPEKIRDFTIVLDGSNAMGSQYLDALFGHLPCKLIKLNFELDGNFPVHEADPFKDENNRQIQEKVKETEADLGIVTDGDGDRIFFIDNLGKTIDPALIRGLMAKILIRKHPGAKICYDIRPGKITRDMILESGGVPCITKVGHSLIKEQGIKEGAIFAGESSGHFFMKMEHGFYEAPMIVILKLLEEFSQSSMPISEYLAPYQRYFHSGEINFKVSDKEKVMKAVEERYSDGQKNMLDGLTVEYSDFWFNIRPSNTESVLRLNLEAVSEAIMKAKKSEIISIIEQGK